MSPKPDRARGVTAALLLLVAIITAPDARPAQPPRGIPPDPAPLPDPGDVVSAWLKLREWTNEFELPAPHDPQARLELYFHYIIF